MDTVESTKKKILSVEDDVFLRDLLAQKFNTQEFDMLYAVTGAEGLQFARQHHPDLVLLDVLLPEGNGFDVLKEIKEDPELKTIPVIMLTNLGQQADIDKAKELGATGFIIKANTSLDEIVRRVKNTLEQV